MTLLSKLALSELAEIHLSFPFQAACSPTTACGERGPALGASLQAAHVALEEAGWVAQALGPRAGTRPRVAQHRPVPHACVDLCPGASRGGEAKRL